MRRLMTGVCMLGLWGASEAAAQQASLPIRVAPGQSYSVTLDYDQEMAFGGETSHVRSTVVTRLDIETPTRWQYTPVSMAVSGMEDWPGGEALSAIDMAGFNEAMSAALRLGTDIGFECRINVRGQCTEMTNWPQWTARIEDLVLMADGFARVGMSAARGSAFGMETVGRPPGPKPQTVEEAERQAAVSAAAERYDDVAAGEPTEAFDWNEHRVPILQAIAAALDGFGARAAATGLSSYGHIALAQGQTLSVGAPRAFTEDWAMPFSAPPIRMTGTLTLESIDRTAGAATVLRNAELDRDSVRDSIRAMAAYIGGPVMEPLRGEIPQADQVTPEMISAMTEMVLAFADFSVTESTRGDIDLRTGLVRQADTTYTMRVSAAGAAALGMPSLGGEEEAEDEDGAAEDDKPDQAAQEPVNLTIRQVLRVTPGAPETQRLPRAN